MGNVYWEKQHGGMCRLHSINAYFGKHMYTVDMFNTAANEFDTMQRDKFGTVTSCQSFDIMHSDQRNIVSYILGNHGIYTRYVPYSDLARHHDDAMASSCFFVFNLNHIWIVKKHEEVWYKVDSIGGVRQINPNTLYNEKNMGIMIPISNLGVEYTRLSILIKIDTTEDIINFLTTNHASKKILGNIEVYMGTMIEILKIQRGANSKFAQVNSLIDNYDIFVRELCTNAQYNNLPFLLKHVPPIVCGILQIGEYFSSKNSYV
jgi:hypothetical protein